MLEKAFILGFIVFAVYYSMLDGEIFGRLGRWFYKKIPEGLHQPVFDCPICMVPWYGSVAYWLIWGVSIKEWLTIIPCTMGINFVLNSIRSND